MHDQHWAGNPYNRKDQLMQYALPNLLFRECHLNCVDYEHFLASNKEETACVKNCQEKIYSAIDIMMAVKMRMEANKSTEGVIDISAYTEMEIEHSHDTASVINARYGTHASVSDGESQDKMLIGQVNKGVREKALYDF